MCPVRSEQLITVFALQKRLNEPGHDVGHSLFGLPRHLLAAGVVAAEDAQPAAPVVFFISQVRQRLVGVEDRATRQLDPVDDRSAGQLPRTPEEDVVGPAAVDDLDALGVAVVGIAVDPNATVKIPTWSTSNSTRPQSVAVAVKVMARRA